MEPGGCGGAGGHRVDDEEDALVARAGPHRICDALHPFGAATRGFGIVELEFVLLMVAGAFRSEGHCWGSEAMEGDLFDVIGFDTNDVPRRKLEGSLYLGYMLMPFNDHFWQIFERRFFREDDADEALDLK
jgi:hypothetical protein